jgi:type VI secretion system secreted protein Hcp
MDMILMKVPGVTGTSMVKGFVGQIELMSYSHGISMQVTGDVSNAERTSGKPRHQDFHVTKYMDQSSPTLYQKLCQGADLGAVIVTVGRNDNGNIIPLIVYTFGQAMLSSVSVGGGGGDKPVESLSINYGSIKWDYQAQKETGGKGGTASTSWNVADNSAK